MHARDARQLVKPGCSDLGLEVRTPALPARPQGAPYHLPRQGSPPTPPPTQRKQNLGWRPSLNILAG